MICGILDLLVGVIYPANQSLLLFMEYDNQTFMKWISYWLI